MKTQINTNNLKLNIMKIIPFILLVILLVSCSAMKHKNKYSLNQMTHYCSDLHRDDEIIYDFESVKYFWQVPSFRIETSIHKVASVEINLPINSTIFRFYTCPEVDTSEYELRLYVKIPVPSDYRIDARLFYENGYCLIPQLNHKDEYMFQNLDTVYRHITRIDINTFEIEGFVYQELRPDTSPSNLISIQKETDREGICLYTRDRKVTLLAVLKSRTPVILYVGNRIRPGYLSRH